MARLNAYVGLDKSEKCNRTVLLVTANILSVFHDTRPSASNSSKRTKKGLYTLFRFVAFGDVRAILLGCWTPLSPHFATSMKSSTRLDSSSCMDTNLCLSAFIVNSHLLRAGQVTRVSLRLGIVRTVYNEDRGGVYWVKNLPEQQDYEWGDPPIAASTYKTKSIVYTQSLSLVDLSLCSFSTICVLFQQLCVCKARSGMTLKHYAPLAPILPSYCAITHLLVYY